MPRISNAIVDCGARERKCRKSCLKGDLDNGQPEHHRALPFLKKVRSVFARRRKLRFRGCVCTVDSDKNGSTLEAVTAVAYPGLRG